MRRLLLAFGLIAGFGAAPAMGQAVGQTVECKTALQLIAWRSSRMITGYWQVTVEYRNISSFPVQLTIFPYGQGQAKLVLLPPLTSQVIEVAQMSRQWSSNDLQRVYPVQCQRAP